MGSVNQARPHCVNQMGKTHSKPLAARHGHGTLFVNRPLLINHRCCMVDHGYTGPPVNPRAFHSVASQLSTSVTPLSHTSDFPLHRITQHFPIVNFPGLYRFCQNNGQIATVKSFHGLTFLFRCRWLTRHRVANNRRVI